MEAAGPRHSLNWACTPLLWPFLAGALTLVWADVSPDGFWWLAPFVCLGAAVFRKRWGWLFAAVLAFWLGVTHTERLAVQEVWRDQGRCEVRGTGVVIGQPVYQWTSSRFFCQVERAEGLPAGAVLEMKWPGNEVKHGERVTFHGLFEPAKGPRNPGQFDRKSFLWRQGVPLSCVRMVRLGREGAVWWRLPIRWTQEVASELEKRLVAGLPEDSVEARVIKAVVLGHRPDRADPVLQDFRDSGTLHIFAVSGLHVGLVVLVVGAVLRLIGLPLTWVSTILIGVALSYAAVTGFPPAAVRAALMVSCVFLGVIFRLRAVFFNGMALSALLALIWDTHQFFQPGFQLSYGVLTVIVLTTAWVMQWMRPLVEVDEFLPASLLTKWQRRALVSRRYMAGLVATSFTAWIGSIPLSGAYFRMFTPVSILASVILAPQVVGLMSAALLSLLVGLVSEHGQRTVNQGTALFARSAAKTAKLMSEVPGGSWDLQRFFAEKEQIVIFDLPSGGNGVAVNVGDGLLIDCGSAKAYRSILLDGLRCLAMRPADVIVTHPAVDACGGLEPLMSAGNSERLWVPVDDARSVTFDSGIAEARRQGVRVSRPPVGTWCQLGKDCRWRVLNASWKQDGTVLADDYSLVVQIEVNGWRILLMGDAGQVAQQDLLESRYDLRSDVVVYGESRRAGADMDQFWDAVNPRMAILANSERVEDLAVSEVLFTQLEKRGVEIFLQAESGAVTLLTGDTLQAEAFVSKRRAYVVSTGRSTSPTLGGR